MPAATQLLKRSFRLTLMMTSLLVTGCGTAPQWPQPQLSALVPDGPGESQTDAALRLLNAGQPGLAVATLQKTVNDQPSERALNLLGVAYDAIGRHDLARVYFTRALALNPEAGDILHNIGYSYYLEDNFFDATVYFQKAIASRDPSVAAQARGRLMLIAAKTPAPPAPEIRKMPSSGLVRTGERTYELRTGCDECRTQEAPQIQKMPPSELPAAEKFSQAVVAATSQDNTTAVLRRSSQIEVSNGAGRRKLAARIGTYLSTKGLVPNRVTNADNFSYQHSVIFYPATMADAASRLAAALPIEVALTPRAGGGLQLVLGRDILGFDAEITQGSAS